MLKVTINVQINTLYSWSKIINLHILGQTTNDNIFLTRINENVKLRLLYMCEFIMYLDL